jgi:hypothetical protein
MRRALALLALVALPAPAQDGPAPDDPFKAPSAEEINAALDRGVAWLKAAQRKDGSWGPCVASASYNDPRSGPMPCYDVGPTAFSIFTLATCGVARDDRAVKTGLGWIERKRRAGHVHCSYESSAVILMYAALNGVKPPADGKLPRSDGSPPKGSGFRPDEWREMEARIESLLRCFQRDGGFGYYEEAKDGYADTSATQFAILALRAASFAGYPVEKRGVWVRTAAYLQKVQAKSGGFPYKKPHAPSRGMTAAALSSLFICREQIRLQGGDVATYVADAITKGLAHLEADFDLTGNPSEHDKGDSLYHYCHLYAIERTGVLSGRREFAGKDWYLRGAAWLLAQQGEGGGWRDETCMAPEDTLGTCFALLFLKRATPPAVTASRD